MKKDDCSKVSPHLHGHYRRELSARVERRVSAHLASCASCADERGRLEAFDGLLDAVRGDDLIAEVGDAQLRPLRTRVMAAVREDTRSPSLPIFRFAWAGAAAALALTVLVWPAAQPGSEVSGPTDAVVVASEAAPAAGVDVITVASREGVKLNWAGAEQTYMVYKMSRPGAYADAEVTVVCGTSWTDANDSAGVVFYAVRPVEPSCA